MLPAIAFELANNIVKLVILLIESTPIERRLENSERWYKLFDPINKLIDDGLKGLAEKK